MKGVVVGVDGSPGAAIALDFAVEEARLRGLVLHVVAAWQFPTTAYGAGVYSGDLSAELRAGAANAVDEALDGLDLGDLRVERHVVEGHAADVLLKAAADAEVLVVGSRGLGGFGRLLLGSIGHEVVHHAPCPTVIVPTPRDRA